MNRTNKVLLYVGMIAAVTGMPSCYAAQGNGAGDMFDRLSPEQQIDFVKQVPFEITLQILKHLPQETKNLVLESFRQSLESQLPQGIDNGQAIPMTNCTKELLEELSYSDVWRDSNELSSLRIAVSAGQKEEIVRILNEMRTQNALELQRRLDRAFLDESRNNNIEGVQLLIELGADINTRCIERSGGVERSSTGTALHFAAEGNNKNLAEFLINKGADINVKDYDGFTPLYWALKHDSKEIAELIISRIPDINEKGKYGETPLHWASQYNRKDIAEILVSKGADINTKNDYEDTPLHRAAKYGSYEIVEILLSKGANVNAKNKSNETPLLSAAKAMYTLVNKPTKAIFELLVSNGADVKATTNYSQETSLHELAKANQIKEPAAVANLLAIAELLISKGADINAKDKYGKTPLYVARQYRNNEMAKFLRDHDAKLK